jgi:uncharacterized membrane-anchored protein YjiN (DUF445 family)
VEGKKRNRLGSASLAAAIAGFLAVELQPWLPLADLALAGSLTLKGLLEAFFEASMVGAIADWFAVTALFKSPLGLKLPHTNILAKNKASIADAVPRFLKGFVDEEAAASALRAVDFASKAAEALSGEGRAELRDFLKRRIAEALVAYGGGEAEKSAALRRFTDDLLGFVAETVDLPSELSALLAWARKGRYDERLLEAFAEFAQGEIGRSRQKLVAILTPLVKRNAGWRGIFVGQGTVESFLDGIRDELSEMKADKSNEGRRFLISSIAGFAARLAPTRGEASPEGRKMAETFRAAIADESFRAGFASFAAQLLSRLGADLAGPEGRVLASLERVEAALVARLERDEELRSRLNSALASVIMAVIRRGRVIEGAVEYLAGVLRATDDAAFVGRIEDAVRDDLQYIRVNGAVVGGLVGVAIALGRALLGA